LTFGRDASCDVVIPSSEVSRRHAEVVPGDVGYVLSDTSTNGVFVNGTRIEAMQVLGRGDVMRIGTEEFRFYADVLPTAPAVASPAPAYTAPAVAPASAPAAPAAPAVAAGNASAGAAKPPAIADPSPAAAPIAPAPAPIPRPAEPAAPSAGAAAGRPPLAALDVIGDGSGIPRGSVFALASVLAHVGRGTHNDVVIAEESVSDSHAKLQRRDGVWYVTDLGSTNGTYLNGRRITAEERLSPDTDLRFGGVKLNFRVSATEPTTEPRAFTRQFGVPDTRRPAAAAPAPTRARPPERRTVAPPPERGGIPWWAWLIALVAIGGAAVYLFLARR
jgi:pSer/pThr/pTyr-binding forkhead associated (FHA) protein